MLSLDQRVIGQAIRWCEAGKPVWLCTVLHTWGSAPRSPGAMLVADGAGQWLGSLSGGCIEEDFLQRLSDGAYPAISQTVRYGADGLPTAVRLPCGGVLEVLIERLPPDTTTQHLLSAMLSALSGGATLVRYLVIGERHEWQTRSPDDAIPTLAWDANSITLPIGAVTTLLIAGYSAVASDCIRLGLMLGYNVVVCEHREEEFAQLNQHISPADNLQRLCVHPARYLEQCGASNATAILCLTHDPRIDDLTLMEAVQTSAFYIGAMGSAKNSASRRQRLTRLGELTPSSLSRIHAPIGLAIGSKTPGEIALATLADVVRVRNGVAPLITRGDPHPGSHLHVPAPA